MTCAKKTVRASLICLDGKVYYGSNACLNPQSVCPRTTGDGYLKCLTICKQPMHAEMAALFAAEDGGSEPRGGRMIIWHDRCCEECQRLLDRYQITWELKA